MPIEVRNPATEDLIESFDRQSDAEIEAALDTAEARFGSWCLTSFAERAAPMRRAAELLEARADQYARQMVEEMGKPIVQARAEVEKCAWVCRHYAEEGKAYLADEVIETEAKRAYVRHLPLGPVLAVMPWNFPFWQVFRFAAPTLMAGNVALLKHASNVPRSALTIERVLREAGFPEGCFQTLLVGSDKVETILADRRVRAATLTGSGPAGAAVASLAGQHIKPSLLELGGADAFIVLPSAELDAAVETAVTARIQNNGQSCIAAKRFFIHADVYEAFTDRFVSRFEGLVTGDPMEEATEIGPLATAQGREDVTRQVEASLKAGARRLTELPALPERGWYVAPQVFTDIPDDAALAREEVFGPVAGLWRVASLDEAIARANASELGLGSAVFTQDTDEIDLAVRDLEAGSTFINARVASDPRLPFGGVKASGYGRELAADGIRAFVNRKTVSIN